MLLQHSHSDCGVDAKEVQQRVMACLGQWLSQNISTHMLGANKGHLHCAVSDFLSDEVMADVNMFGSGMVLWVLGQVNGPFAVSNKDSATSNDQTQLRQECPPPYCFLGGLSSSHILCLH